MRDAVHDAGEEAAVVEDFLRDRLCSVPTFPLSHFLTCGSVFRDRPKPQRVQRANRTRTHREDVAHDAADAGGRALEGFDRARMVVRFDLERDGEVVADVDDARVLFARADENFRRLGREGLQQRPGVLVGTMLAPHHGEDAQLGVVGLTADDLLDLRVFVRREVVLLDQFGRDRGFLHQFKVLSSEFKSVSGAAAGDGQAQANKRSRER